VAAMPMSCMISYSGVTPGALRLETE
jgi:hypothetical protein